MRQRVVVVAWDQVGLDDALELMNRQVAEGAWTYGLLHDLRQITWIPTIAEIRRLISHLETLSRGHGRRGPVAFVTVDETLFGMTRMYSMLGERASLTAEVFRDPIRAEQWLDDVSPYGT